MEITLDIQESLLAEARKIASRENTTIEALVEEGLRLVLTRRSEKRPFRMRKATFKGEGLQTPWSENSWLEMRDSA